ncbi:MAG: DUF2029 domain-containing protein, partial [Mycobacterium sp.]|nr:DUF2029 domain-containing protein [Mycobacterium sp.]
MQRLPVLVGAAVAVRVRYPVSLVGGRDTQAGLTVAPRIRRFGPAVLAVAVVLYVVVYALWPSLATQVDLQVYRFAALRLWHGLDLYSIGLTGNSKELLFIYPPFAALCFLPLALVGEPVVQVLWLTLTWALIVWAIWRMLKSMAPARTPGLWSLVALLVGVVAWLEPIRLTLQLGQINVVILALVMADLLSSAQRRWAGVGIGIAAGLKLTPALFIVYLAATGRLRAASVAAVTLVATIAAGFVLLPAGSTFYWLRHGFDDPGRIAQHPFASTANASLGGLLMRLHVPPAPVAVAAVVMAVAAVTLAAVAYRRGHAVLGSALVGMASAAVSPFSWSHHWVWFAPLLVHLGYRAHVLRSRSSTWTFWALAALLGGWFTSFGEHRESGVLSLRPGGIWKDIIPG